MGSSYSYLISSYLPISQETFSSFDKDSDGLLFHLEASNFFEKVLVQPLIAQQFPRTVSTTNVKTNAVLNIHMKNVLPCLSQSRLLLSYFDKNEDGALDFNEWSEVMDTVQSEEKLMILAAYLAGNARIDLWRKWKLARDKGPFATFQDEIMHSCQLLTMSPSQVHADINTYTKHG
jgi:hypothetical protein